MRNKVSLNYLLKISFYSMIMLSVITITSCGLFDKDLKQDKHIAAFRHQIYSVHDSLNNPKDRIKAFENIIEQINSDKAIFNSRKRNNVLTESYFSISNEYHDMQIYDKAIEYSDIAINLDSTNAVVYFNRGCIFQTMGKDSLAIADYIKALRLNPNYADVYYNRAIIYEAQGNYDMALDDYNHILRLKPNYMADVYNNRGNVYQALKSFDKAMIDYNKAVSLDSTHIKAYYNRAELFVQKEKYDAAIADYSKVLLLDSSDTDLFDIYLKRGEVYALQGKYEDAISDYKKALELDPYNKSGLNKDLKREITRFQSLQNSKK